MTPVRLFVKSPKKSAVSKFGELTGEVGSCARPGELVASRSGNMPSWAADDLQPIGTFCSVHCSYHVHIPCASLPES